MTDEQNPELAAAPAPATPEPAAPASDVQPEIKKEYVSTEPRHPLMDILDKADAKAKAKAEATSAETKKEALPQDKGAAFDYSKWDGNVLTLPENIRKIVDDNKAAFHTKAQEAAQYKEQFDKLQSQVNDYLAQMKAQNQQPLFTEDEFQAAQLDPAKFLDLSSRVAKDIVEKEKAQLVPMITQIQFNQKVAENEKRINDFAKQHEDFWNLYEAGVLEPLVSQHGLEKGYEMASGMAKKLEQAAVQKSQARVQEKKASTSVTPTPSSMIEVLYVNNPKDVLPTQIRMAAEGKKVKVRYKPD